MGDTENMLEMLYQARLEDLREIAVENDISKMGNVEQLRSRLISEMVLSANDLSWDGIQNTSNEELGNLLGIFGIKKTGSIKARRQRLWLHINQDPKKLTVESLQRMTRDDLHGLCIKLELPRSGSKTDLLSRVAGVLVSQEKSWGKIKKSLKRGGSAKQISLPPIIDSSPEPTLDFEPIEAEEELVNDPLPEPMAIPSSTQRATLGEIMNPEQLQSMRDNIERFVDSQEGDWTFEDEAVLRSELLAEGIPINHPRVSTALAEWLTEASDRHTMSTKPELQKTVKHDVGTEQAILELEARNAELESSIRDFLLIGKPDDYDDLQAFYSSLESQGFAIELSGVKQRVATKLEEISSLVDAEREAVHLGPDSWREREALRKLENVRPQLLEGLESILEACEGDMVQGRLEFEKLARDCDLDLRLPAVSGRLHGLFDLQVSLNESIALQDPRIARRERIVRIMQHGAIHLSDSARVSLDRLERNVAGFENVVEAILRKSDGNYGVGEQALLIRFLEQRGYSVNTAELRPRIVACGGVVGVELGFISPQDVPPLPSGINLSETEVDAVVAELRSVVNEFGRPELPEEEEESEEIRLGEAVAEASETVDRVRSNLDKADALLGRLNLTSND